MFDMKFQEIADIHGLFNDLFRSYSEGDQYTVDLEMDSETSIRVTFTFIGQSFERSFSLRDGVWHISTAGEGWATLSRQDDGTFESWSRHEVLLDLFAEACHEASKQ